MIVQILTFNKCALPKNYLVTKEMFEEKVELTPQGIWEWGESTSLLHEEPSEVLIYNLLPKGKATVTRGGIKFSEMCYSSKLGLKNGWFVECKIDEKKDIEICYDPRNVSSIFIRLNSGKIEQCFLTGMYKEYDGLHLEDVKAIMKYKKDEINNKEKEEKQHKAVLHAFSENLVNGAIIKTKDATKDMSITQRQKNKRETKKLESRNVGSENAITSVSKDEEAEINVTAKLISFPKENHESTICISNNLQKVFEEKSKKRRNNRGSTK
jgi:hypothetical protein